MSNYIKNIVQGLGTIFTGMNITAKNFFSSNVAVQYPDIHPLEKAGSDRMPDNARNRLAVIIPKCTGCKSCQKACPVNCISIETVKVAANDPDKPTMEDGKRRVMWLAQFDIDFAKCCFCGFCTTACPTDAIITTTEFEYSCYDRDDLLYHFSTLSAEQVSEKRKLLAEEARLKAEKAAAEKAAAEKAAQEAPKESNDQDNNKPNHDSNLQDNNK